VTLDDKALDSSSSRPDADRLAPDAGHRRSAAGDLPDHAVRPDERQLVPGGIPLVRTPRSDAAASRADPGQRRQTKAAPVTAIIGYERASTSFSELFPHRARDEEPVRGEREAAETVAFPARTLQGAYFMLARVPCGSRRSRDVRVRHAKVDAEFFPEVA